MDSNPSVSLPSRDSELSKLVMAWLIAPMSLDEFYADYWEKKPLVIHREDRDHYSRLFSLEGDMKQWLKDGILTWEKDLDVTSYRDGKRTTLNGTGKPEEADVMGKFESGCSMRLLCPHAHKDIIWATQALLENHFGSFVGSNIYMTPAGSQGFAPHYDDIEAFIMQLSGSKHWFVYEPRYEEEEMARFSSPNFEQASMGDPIIETDIHSGDFLYIPRGWPHQARSLEEAHSVHITMSTALHMNWADMLETAMPIALKAATDSMVDLRRSIPRGFHEYMGVMVGEDAEEEEGGGAAGAGSAATAREAFMAQLFAHVQQVVEAIPVDETADQMRRKFIRERLPPPTLSATKEVCDMIGAEAGLAEEVTMDVPPSKEVELSTDMVLAPMPCVLEYCHMAVEGEEAVVYHCLGNSRRYLENEETRLTYPLMMAPSVERLLRGESVTVGELLEAQIAAEQEDDSEEADDSVAEAVASTLCEGLAELVAEGVFVIAEA